MTEAPSPRSHDPLDDRRLTDLVLGQSGAIERLDLVPDDARRLMQLGFLPGAEVTYARRSPFGDPLVFRIDDAEIALRRETARQIRIHPLRVPTEPR